MGMGRRREQGRLGAGALPQGAMEGFGLRGGLQCAPLRSFFVGASRTRVAEPRSEWKGQAIVTRRGLSLGSGAGWEGSLEALSSPGSL